MSARFLKSTHQQALATERRIGARQCQKVGFPRNGGDSLVWLARSALEQICTGSMNDQVSSIRRRRDRFLYLGAASSRPSLHLRAASCVSAAFWADNTKAPRAHLRRWTRPAVHARASRAARSSRRPDDFLCNRVARRRSFRSRGREPVLRLHELAPSGLCLLSFRGCAMRAGPMPMV